MTEERRAELLILQPQDARLDASKAPALREALTKRIDAGEQTVILDLSKVNFMDSSALSALIAAVKKMGPLGTIAVAEMRPPVEKLLKITRMDRVFPLHATVDDAVAKLSA